MKKFYSATKKSYIVFENVVFYFIKKRRPCDKDGAIATM